MMTKRGQLRRQDQIQGQGQDRIMQGIIAEDPGQNQKEGQEINQITGDPFQNHHL